MKKYIEINKQLNKLAKMLCADILEYKENILSTHHIFDIAIYKNLSNLFQDNDQQINYEYIKHYYSDFYNKYFDKYKSSTIIKTITPQIVEITRYQWKHGDNTPINPEECLEISKNELDRELNEFFKIMFNTIFHYSYIYNYIIDNFNNVSELQKIAFKTYEEYKNYLIFLSCKYNVKSNRYKEKIFYKKAIKKIIYQIFLVYTFEGDLYNIQKHLFYLSGVKLNKFQYKLSTDIILRTTKLNEIPLSSCYWDKDYNKDICVIEQKYKYKDYGEVISNNHIIPIFLNLAFKHCVRIKRICNYLEIGEEGESQKQELYKKYDGNIPCFVQDEFILELPKIIKLCSYYIDNVEKDYNNLDFISIALDFYSQALEKVHPTHKITYACLTLEALFNTNSEKIIQQLTRRAAVLLNITLSKNQKHIKKIIQQSYKIRCAYVHGQNPLCSYNEDLVEEIFDIARFSIVVFLQLYKNIYFKNKTLKSNINIKTLINDYYINNFDIMPNLKKEFILHIPDFSWINNLKIKNRYCNYRNLNINEYEFSNYFKWTNLS